MVNDKLQKYIQDQLKTGHDKQFIERQLLKAGWDKETVHSNLFPRTPHNVQRAKEFHKSKVTKHILLGVALLVLLGGTTYAAVSFAPNFFSTGTDHLIGALDEECETWDCFVFAAGSCAETRFTASYPIDFFGAIINTTYFYTINSTDEGCELSSRIESIEFSLSQEIRDEMLAEGMTEQDIEEMLQEEPEVDMVGYEGFCVFNTNQDLQNYLEYLRAGEYSVSMTCDTESCEVEGGGLENATCSGPLYEGLN